MPISMLIDEDLIDCNVGAVCGVLAVSAHTVNIAFYEADSKHLKTFGELGKI